MDNKFTLYGAMEYKKLNKIEEWVHEFLLDIGNNKDFSDGLKLEKRYYYGPVKMPLSMFRRICGPEEDMKYQNPKDGFEYHVGNMINSIGDGWDLPPLIINYTNKEFELNDGNHRYEALVRSNISDYYVIFWTSNVEDYKELLKFDNTVDIY